MVETVEAFEVIKEAKVACTGVVRQANEFVAIVEGLRLYLRYASMIFMFNELIDLQLILR